MYVVVAIERENQTNRRYLIGADDAPSSRTTKSSSSFDHGRGILSISAKGNSNAVNLGTWRLISSQIQGLPRAARTAESSSASKYVRNPNAS